MFNKKITKFLISMAIGVLSLYVPYVLGGDAKSIGDVAGAVTSTFENIAKLLTAGSYVAGFGLTVGSLFKFKAHKDNPQQQPLGTCIVMLLVGVCLIFLPSVLQTGGQTLFGGGKEGSVTGFTTTTK